MTTAQVIRADRELFTIMAQEIQTSVQALPDGTFPMENKLRELRTDPRVTMHMLPLPKAYARDPQADKRHGGDKADDDPRPDKIKPKKKVRPSPKAKALCLDELKNYQQKDEHGNAICWAFNLKNGCKEPTSNGRCKKVMHVCIKCRKSNHSLTNCRVRDN